MPLQPNASSLKDRRNGGADDILAVLGKVGVTARGKRAKMIASVAEKGHLEHVDCGACALGERDFRDLTSAYGWRWPLSLRTRFFGL